jgi:hypothetical protein
VGDRRPRPSPAQPLNTRRERVLLAGLAFVVTIVATRIVTGVLHLQGAGEDGGLIIAGVHLHHFVFGIAILLATSLMWLLLGGIDDQAKRWFRITAVAYGVGTGLLLDEFALWLHLEDVDWQEQGRRSIDAIAGFIVVLGLAVLIRPYGAAAWKRRRSR